MILCFSFVELLALTAVYAYAWFHVYFERVSYRLNFYPGGLGHRGTIAIYFFLLLFAMQTYGGGGLGSERSSKMILSQFFGIFFANFITYLQLCLMSMWMVRVVPMLIMSVVQMAVALAFLAVYEAGYRRFVLPRSLLLVYGEYPIASILEKLGTRGDRFKVEKCMGISEGMEAIQTELLRGRIDQGRTLADGKTRHDPADVPACYGPADRQTRHDFENDAAGHDPADGEGRYDFADGRAGLVLADKENGHALTNREAAQVPSGGQAGTDKSRSPYDAVVLWDLPNKERNDLLKLCYGSGIRVYLMPKITDVIIKGMSPLHFFDTPIFMAREYPLKLEERVAKRALDLICSLLLGILTSPFMLLTALAVKLYDGGPVLYKQTRVTLGNREFQILKFRSMSVSAEADGVARLAGKQDARITPVGRFIRSCRLDELPQLWNIFKGEMSFVGPRPERPELIRKYMEEMPEFAFRTRVKAGLAGYAQIYGKYNTTPYDKLKLDLYYIENYSFWLDLQLMLLTPKILLTPESTEGVSEKEAPGQESGGPESGKSEEEPQSRSVPDRMAKAGKSEEAEQISCGPESGKSAEESRGQSVLDRMTKAGKANRQLGTKGDRR